MVLFLLVEVGGIEPPSCSSSTNVYPTRLVYSFFFDNPYRINNLRIIATIPLKSLSGGTVLCRVRFVYLTLQKLKTQILNSLEGVGLYRNLVTLQPLLTLHGQVLELPT